MKRSERKNLEERLERVRQFVDEAKRREAMGREYEWGGSPGAYWEGVRDGMSTVLNALDGVGSVAAEPRQSKSSCTCGSPACESRITR